MRQAGGTLAGLQPESSRQPWLRGAGSNQQGLSLPPSTTPVQGRKGPIPVTCSESEEPPPLWARVLNST